MTLKWKIALFAVLVDVVVFVLIASLTSAALQTTYNSTMNSIEYIWGLLHFPTALLSKYIIDFSYTSTNQRFVIGVLGYAIMFMQTFIVGLFVGTFMEKK